MKFSFQKSPVTNALKGSLLTLLVVCLALAFGAGSAGAATVVSTVAVPDGTVDNPAPEWLANSRMPSPPVLINLRYQLCRTLGAGSCAIVQKFPTHPDAYLYTVDAVPFGGPRFFYHEIGHVFDLSGALDQGARNAMARWLRVSTWDLTAKERFAEAYSFCAVGPITHSVMTGYYGFSLSELGLKQVCRLTRASAARTIPTGQYIPSITITESTTATVTG